MSCQSFQLKSSAVDPSKLNLDTDPEFWPNLDPDLDPGYLDPQHCWYRRDLPADWLAALATRTGFSYCVRLHRRAVRGFTNRQPG